MMSTAGLISQAPVAGALSSEQAPSEPAGEGDFAAALVAAAEPAASTPDGTQSAAAMALLAGLLTAGARPPDAPATDSTLEGGEIAMQAASQPGQLPPTAVMPAALLKAMGISAQHDAAVAAQNETFALDVPQIIPGNEAAAAPDATGDRLIGALLERVSAQLAASDGEQHAGPGPSLYANTREVVANAAGAASSLPEAVRTAVGSPRWANELGSRLVMMSTRGQQEGSLTLTPEHLGPLEVRISVSQDTTNVWFGAQHADTRAALTDALPRLREMLAASGLALGHAGVSHEMPRQDARRSEQQSASRGAEPISVEAVAPAAPRRIGSALLDAWA